METNEYDYLNGLEEEDRLALIEMAEKRKQQEEEKYEEIKKDIEDKYTQQTSALVATFLAATIMVGTVWFASSAIKDYRTDLSPKTKIEDVIDDNIYVIRNYTAEIGDSLTYLSKISGMTIDEIKDFNNLKSDMLKYNQKISLKYVIQPENIDYLTDSILVDGRSIYEIAGLYKTTPESIYNLNKEAIEKVVNSNSNIDYVILSNTLLVPNYLTPKELQNVKK